MTTADKVEQIYAYVQERCLWQFFSRTWDRQENIDGILTAAAALLKGEAVPRDTPMQKLFYSDATVMVADFKERFPWITQCSFDEIGELMAGLKERLVDIAITRSLNAELHHSLY